MKLSTETQYLQHNLLERIVSPGGAFDYLGMPDYESTPGYNDLTIEEILETSPVNYDPQFVHKPNRRDIELNLLKLEGINQETFDHSLRTGLFSIKIMDFLEIRNGQQRRDFFTASLLHDIGKYCIHNGLEAKEFTEKDIPKIKQRHAITSAYILRRIYGDYIAGIVERHHKHQKDSYPKELIIPSTPEIEILSRIFAIIDFQDSAATRKNGKFTNPAIKYYQRLFNIKPKLPSKEKVKSAIIEEYGEMRLNYLGCYLPHMCATGREFIERLYETKIFGSSNPHNPFEAENSFKFP